MTFTIRAAEMTDLPFVVDLQRKNRESVGGLPVPAFEERVGRQGLLVSHLNGEPFGYLLFDFKRGIVRVPQACIAYDARRRHYGVALVEAMLRRCVMATEVRLRCAADIEANVFWRSLGFQCSNTVLGGSRRGRLINLWQLWLNERLFDLDSVSVDPAAQRRIDCFDVESGFLDGAPAGFREMGDLPKLAFSNMKAVQ